MYFYFSLLYDFNYFWTCYINQCYSPLSISHYCHFCLICNQPRHTCILLSRRNCQGYVRESFPCTYWYCEFLFSLLGLPLLQNLVAIIQSPKQRLDNFLVRFSPLPYIINNLHLFMQRYNFLYFLYKGFQFVVGVVVVSMKNFRPNLACRYVWWKHCPPSCHNKIWCTRLCSIFFTILHECLPRESLCDIHNSSLVSKIYF